ncbi:hypothetical protein [uncultured Chloroflexus sp.]|uniref:hypothetical protein n=1 Tax=uncultured Chloroflexus sp. TaxID=214040 RepID=UPI00263536A6|nr:hypothetical protein [uncultured Chloroflexus sp.]
MKLTTRKWFYPLVYITLVFIAFLPLYTERPYDPRNDTSQVIFEILQRATVPYAAWGWIFHLATLAVVGFTVWQPTRGGRVIAGYFGLNYLVIAAIQTHAVTPTYGFAVHTGALVAEVLLGTLWLRVAWLDKLRLDWQAIPRWRWLLLPFALLVFWSPLRFEGTTVLPDFNPLLLLTSPDYGLAYCFVTPVFLFVLILAWPQVDGFALRVTAFNGLLYGLFNLSHWTTPERVWIGVMHLPLLVMPMVALWLAQSQPRLQPSYA